MLVAILQRKTLSESEANYFLSISVIPSGDPFFCTSGRLMVKRINKKRKKKAEKKFDYLQRVLHKKSSTAATICHADNVQVINLLILMSGTET